VSVGSWVSERSSSGNSTIGWFIASILWGTNDLSVTTISEELPLFRTKVDGDFESQSSTGCFAAVVS